MVRTTALLAATAALVLAATAAQAPAPLALDAHVKKSEKTAVEKYGIITEFPDITEFSDMTEFPDITEFPSLVGLSTFVTKVSAPHKSADSSSALGTLHKRGLAPHPPPASKPTKAPLILTVSLFGLLFYLGVIGFCYYQKVSFLYRDTAPKINA